MENTARIRISSREVNQLNEICEQIKDIAKQAKVKMSGPIMLPTKKLLIPTRKSVSGDGTASWERWEMRIHKRVIDVEPNDRVMRQVMRIQVPDGVNIEIEVKS